MLRIPAVEPLALEIGGLDFLHTLTSVEAVDAPVNGQLDMLRGNGAGDGDLVLRAADRHGLQRLMPADAVQQARGRGHRRKTAREHNGFYKGSYGDAAFFQLDLHKKRVQLFALPLYHSIETNSSRITRQKKGNRMRERRMKRTQKKQADLLVRRSFAESQVIWLVTNTKANAILY